MTSEPTIPVPMTRAMRNALWRITTDRPNIAPTDAYVCEALVAAYDAAVARPADPDHLAILRDYLEDALRFDTGGSPWHQAARNAIDASYAAVARPAEPYFDGLEGLSERARDRLDAAVARPAEPDVMIVGKDGVELGDLNDLTGGTAGGLVPGDEEWRPAEPDGYAQTIANLRAADREYGARPAEAERPDLRPFNMQGGPPIPWFLAEAIYTHLYGFTGQTLQRLHERSGFGWAEVESMWKGRTSSGQLSVGRGDRAGCLRAARAAFARLVSGVVADDRIPLDEYQRQQAERDA